MGMFGGKGAKEEKQRREIEVFKQKYGLDSLDERDLRIVNSIAGDLAGNGFLKAGMALSFAKAEEQAKVTYLSALVEQNWLIINQLSRINQNLERRIKPQ